MRLAFRDKTITGSGGQIIQVDVLTEATSYDVGRIYQYVGETTDEFTNGYFYKCVETDGVYSWESILVQEGSDASLSFWKPNTAYEVNDVVLYKATTDTYYSIYICKESHTSTETFDETKWEELGGSGGQIGNIITLIDNTVTNDEVIGALASYNYFAKRAIYADENIHMGRKEGSVIGKYSGAIGKDCVASEMYSVAMGNEATASGMYSLAKGNGATASGDCSSAEGYCTIASGYYSHAEGANSESKGWYSHAEGNTTLSKAQNSHCEGFKTITEGQSAHAEGEETLAKGDNSHAQGKLTIANGLQSSAEGLGTIASGDNQTVLGKYNLEDKTHTYALIIGSGVDDSSRNNIYTIDWIGNGKYNGDVIATDIYGNEVSLLTLANNIGGGFYTETFVGNNSKSITINHNIGNPNVSAKVYDATTNKEVEFEIELTSGINLTLKSDILLTPDMKFKIIVTL